MCQVLDGLSAAVGEVRRLPVPVGLGADTVLAEQVAALADAVGVLHRELAIRMAGLHTASRAGGGAPVDVRGTVIAAGVPAALASRLVAVGGFSSTHPGLKSMWLSGSVSTDQVNALRDGAERLGDPETGRLLVERLLPLLPGLDAARTRRLVGLAADQLAPSDPDAAEAAEHAARALAWTGIGDGVAFQGYLPAVEGATFKAAINALVEDLRIEGDQLSPAQRRADALTALIARAAAHGLPTGGGLPAAATLTVSLTEAIRIAARDPHQHGHSRIPRPMGTATISGQPHGHVPAGDAAVRFALCCAAITPILIGPSTDPATAHVTDQAPGAIAGSAPGHPERTEPPAPGGVTGPDPGRLDSSGLTEPGSALALIGDTPVEPLAVGRAVRLATPSQRRALHLRDNGCVISGCGVTAPYTQPHHVTPWALGGKSDLSNLVSLCWIHHRQVEFGRFQFHRRTRDKARPDGALEHPHWWIIPTRKHRT